MLVKNNKLNKKDAVVCVVGLGYVGLTLSIVMAERGLHVIGVDKDDEVFNNLSTGRSHFYERGIQTRIADLVSDKEHCNFAIKKSIASPANIWIITVGTPLGENEEPQLSFMEQVAYEISKYLNKGDLVIARSTVPVGTTRNLVIKILESESSMTAGEDFYVAFAPERTIEGAALDEIGKLPQIVGGFDEKSSQYAETFFGSFVNECVITDSLEAAEMIKLIDNTYRDFIFAYANQMSIVASKMGVSFNNLVGIANYNYPRNKVPMPSPGVGGACLSKDPYLLRASAKNYNTNADFIIQGRKVNEEMPNHVIQMVKERTSQLGINFCDTKIFIMGLAFKGDPPTSDLRNSISLDFIRDLKQEGCVDISGYDEFISVDNIESLGILYKGIEKGFMESNVIMIINNNPNYKEEPIYSYLVNAKKPLVFFDGWNQFNNRTFRSIEGVHYMGC
jgi:UDP-N-acetyl-D-mannosaminuronic acid dehydrogenase